MTDFQLQHALINRDESITGQFFFKDCRPLFVSVISKMFGCELDYDEGINELYLHLMENDAMRLRQFEGRSSIYQWMKVVAIRYFWAKKKRMIERAEKLALLGKDAEDEGVESTRQTMAEIDVRSLLEQMNNPRQVYVIKRLVLDDAEPEKVAKELNVTVDNLYNIKKRALAALTRIAFKS